MHKRILAMLLVVALTMTISVGGTLAYLTDRDSEINVFTVGNVSIDLTEDFEQGATLTPGVDIKKMPLITNTGKNDAWVWMTWAVPTNLLKYDPNTGNTSANVIHTNYMGYTADNGSAKTVDQTTVNKGIEAGYFPEGTTAEYINNGAYWLMSEQFEHITTTKINDVDYTVVAYLYNKALTSDETTLPGIYNVYLDDHIDIDPNGDWYHVEGGVVTDLDWNSNTNGNPVIYVAAYAVQKEGFETVNAAYDAYIDQWGGLNAEYKELTEVTNDQELKAAIAAGKDVFLADGEYTTNLEIAGGSDITITGSKNAVLSGQIATTSSTAGTLTLKGVTVKVDDKIIDSTGISQTSKSAIAIWGNQTVICENVTFDMSLKDSTAITSWWDTGVGTSIIVKDCTFNCNGQRPIRATGNVTVENCTFNDPYRYAVQLTAKTSTATEMDKAIINFKNNTIINGANGKDFVYGIQLEGAEYGCNDCVINGAGNTIENGGADSAMYYCECGKVAHDTIVWNTEVPAVHEN